MARLDPDRRRVRVCLVPILAGLAPGLALPEVADPLETPLRPLPGILIFAAFRQVPRIHLAEAFRDRRFTGRSSPVLPRVAGVFVGFLMRAPCRGSAAGAAAKMPIPAGH